MGRQVLARGGLGLEVLADASVEPAALLFRVKGDASERSRVAVAFLVDVSPSMDGERIFFAKSSVARALEAMEPGDRVIVVGFCRRAWAEYEKVLAGREDIREALRAVARLRTCYGTNIEDALRKGVEALSRGSEGSKVLVLITDGEPNVGARDPGKLAEIIADSGLHILVVGVGSEYNERLLADLANLSGGRMTHVSDPVDLEKPVTEEVMKAARLVARNASLAIKAGDSKIRVYGWRHEEKDGVVEVILGPVSSGEVLDVAAEAWGNLADIEVELRYSRPEGGTEVLGPYKLDPKRLEGPEEADYARFRVKVLRALEEAEKAVEEGDYRRVYELISEVSEATLSLGDTRLYDETVDIAELIRRGQTREASKRIYSTVFKARRVEDEA